MGERQHTVILVVRRMEPSPSDAHHLADFAQDVHGALSHIDDVVAYANVADLKGDIAGGLLVLD